MHGRLAITFTEATPAEATLIAALRAGVATDLTRRFGRGHWSSLPTERGVIYGMRHAKVIIGRAGDRLLTVVRLATKKPWAIDPAYFTACRRPIYLTDMAVAPEFQLQGLGRLVLEEACQVARRWPADAIRLDAYEAEAGAGPFYAKCGFEERGRVTYRKVPLVYYGRLLEPSTR